MYNKGLVLVLTVVFVATVFLCVNTAKAQIVENGLVSYWSFDKATIDGNIVKDLRGKNNGTINGTPKTIIGKIGDAMQFNGTTDFVDCGNDKSLKMADATTLEAWMLIDTFPFPAGYRTVITEHSPASNEGKIFRILDNALQFLLGPAGTPTAGYTFDSSAKAKWQHIVATYDGIAMKLYVNGKKGDEKATTIKIPVNTNSLWIAHSGWGEFFQGTFDEVRIYNRALSETEINKNFASQVPPTTAVSKSTEKLSSTWGEIKSSR
jgi:hypothetical protein